MGDRDAGIGEPADARRDAGHDAERHAGLDQRQGLLAAAPEDEGIAALEPQHPPAVARQLDQAARDVGLLRRGLAAALAGELELGAGPRKGQHALAHQGVVDHHVGLAQRVVGGQGQQARIAGPGADEPDPAGLEIGQLGKTRVHAGNSNAPRGPRLGLLLAGAG